MASFVHQLLQKISYTIRGMAGLNGYRLRGMMTGGMNRLKSRVDFAQMS